MDEWINTEQAAKITEGIYLQRTVQMYCRKGVFLVKRNHKGRFLIEKEDFLAWLKGKTTLKWVERKDKAVQSKGRKFNNIELQQQIEQSIYFYCEISNLKIDAKSVQKTIDQFSSGIHPLVAKLKERRHGLYLGQGKVAEFLGLNHSVIGTWELGRSHPTINNQAKIQCFLDGDYDHLMEPEPKRRREFLFRFKGSEMMREKKTNKFKSSCEITKAFREAGNEDFAVAERLATLITRNYRYKRNNR